MGEQQTEVQAGEETRGPGRPRDPQIDEAVLKVALRQMSAIGYGRMTLDAVAAEAGVTKPAIYRRWAGKEDLATAAIAKLRIEHAPISSGNSKTDLIAVLAAMVISLKTVNGFSMLGTILAEEHHMPEFMRLFRERIVHPRRDMLKQVLRHGIETGQIRPDLDIDAATNMMIGSFHARYLEGGDINEAWPARLVETLWQGIAAK